MVPLREAIIAAAVGGLLSQAAVAQTVQGLPQSTRDATAADRLPIVQDGKLYQISPTDLPGGGGGVAGMNTSASNATLPTALTNLQVPWFFVEAYRLPTDVPGDDTALIARVCAAASPVNGVMVFAGKEYVFSQLFAGSNGTGTLNGFTCHILGAAPNLQVTNTPVTSTTLTQKAGSPNTFITVPKEAPTMYFENVRINGNKANQSASDCTTNAARLINMEDATGTKRRSVYMRNVYIQNACFDGVYAGTLRNAGYFDHVLVADSANRNGVWQANNDWRIFISDFGGAGKDGFLCNGCASFKAVMTNVFENGAACAGAPNCGRGLVIGPSAGDVQWEGGDINRNQQDGVVTAGGTDADGNRQARVFIGTKFSLNGLLADATYADVKITADNGVALIGTQHQKGTVASSGGKYPRNLANSTDASVIYMSGTQFEVSAAHKPYTDTQPVNGMNRVKGDLGIKNTTLSLDDSVNPIVIDMCMADTFNLALHNNNTMGAPTCIWPGKRYTFNVTNVLPGGHTLAWNVAFRWAAGTAPTLSPGSGATDVMDCTAISTTALICTAIQNY